MNFDNLIFLKTLRPPILCYNFLVPIALLGIIFFSANIANADEHTAPVKIAIIGDAGKFRAEMDLLTVALSSEKNLVVLDRTDIDLVLKEHEIMLSEISKNSIRIGKLLGADGIILLKSFNFSGKEYTSALWSQNSVRFFRII